MANDIEEALRNRYKCIINVSNKQGDLFEILVYIKFDLQTSFLILYDSHLEYDKNIKNICDKIDKEIVEIFRK